MECGLDSLKSSNSVFIIWLMLLFSKTKPEVVHSGHFCNLTSHTRSQSPPLALTDVSSFQLELQVALATQQMVQSEEGKQSCVISPYRPPTTPPHPPSVHSAP